MATLTPAQIAAHARAAGLTNADRLATAVAIALGESGGNPAAHNPVGLDDSFGLWQINMRGAQGPQRRAALGIASNSALFDPATNARAMMMISKQGADFTPWTVYTRGIYLVHLPAARAAVNAAPPAPGGGGTGDNPLIPDVIEGPLDAAAGAAAAGAEAVRLATGAGRWLADRHNWLRVAYVTGGGVLLVAALLIATRDPDSAVGKVVKGTKKTAEGAANLAMMVAPQGKAAKAAGGLKAAGGGAKAASSGGAKAASSAPKAASSAPKVA